MPLKSSYVKNSDLIQVLENITEACFFVNSDWEIEFVNKAAVPFVKPFIGKDKEELIGVSFWDALPKFRDTNLYKRCHRVHDEQETNTQVFETSCEYSKLWLEVKLSPFKNGLFVMFSDITDRKEREKQKESYDKLKIIGEMAAGVAHEVRNPMTTVKGFLQMMTQNEELEEYQSIYYLMIDEIDHVNAIITQFLAIANNDKCTNLQYCNLNKLIMDLFPLLETRALIEAKLIVLDLSATLDLKIDKNEIRQVLLNLINNSLDAMISGQTVQITTYKENDTVVLSIRDEGGGIAADILENIGTPFFTTKQEGTGLGLSICFSIAKRNNAEMDFTSSPDGTTFNIRFSC